MSELLEMFGENGYALLVDEGGKVDPPNKKGCSTDTVLQLATESSMDKSLLLLRSQRRVLLMS